MRFKTLERDLPFFKRKLWQWPEGDDKLLIVFEQVHDIDKWVDRVDDFAVCVQAGGACGVWPLRLAQLFGRVHTFEPLTDNYACLMVNCDADNVTAYNKALSNVHKRVSISNDISERRNYGAGYIVDNPDGVETALIDELELDACGLICLDIEGAELDALKGAAKTIDAYKPLIVIEDKPMPQLGHFGRQVGDPGRWLKQFGYELVDRVHWDSVYSC